jgi:hypothetical protein
MKALARCGVVAACLALSACQSTGAQVLENLQGCERHYDGAVSGGLTGAQFSGTIKVDCLPTKGDVAKEPAALPSSSTAIAGSWPQDRIAEQESR